MLIIETPLFTRRIQSLISDDDYRLLQSYLVTRPDAGKVIPGSGGLRKVRWFMSGRGKRGGIRIIYYWVPSGNRLLMLFVYLKHEQEDLSSEQLRMLKKIVEEEYP